MSARSIPCCRRRGPSRPPSQSWRTFLANHAQAIWAADLLVVQTLYVLFLISHDRRRLGLAPNDRSHAMGPTPRYLIHDRDRVCRNTFPVNSTGTFGTPAG